MKRVLTMFFSNFFTDEGLYPAAEVPSSGYFILISTTFFCIIALRLNQRTGSNLMFISSPLPGTMYGTVALLSGELYTPAMILFQMTIPFMVIMWFRKNTSLLNRPAWYDGTFAMVHHHRHA